MFIPPNQHSLDVLAIPELEGKRISLFEDTPRGLQCRLCQTVELSAMAMNSHVTSAQHTENLQRLTQRQNELMEFFQLQSHANLNQKRSMVLQEMDEFFAESPPREEKQERAREKRNYLVNDQDDKNAQSCVIPAERVRHLRAERIRKRRFEVEETTRKYQEKNNQHPKRWCGLCGAISPWDWIGLCLQITSVCK